MTPQEQAVRAKLVAITNSLAATDHARKMAMKKLRRIDPFAADFRAFTKAVWRQINLPVPTDVQYDISKYLQWGPKRCIIEAFRGVGKSFVTGAFVAWHLYRDPQLKIMVVSASKDRSDAFSGFVKRLIAEMPLLRHLQPDPSKGQRDSLVSFDVGPATVDQSPSVKSVGINGQLTGSRADIIIADDVEVPNNSATQTMRDKLAELVKEFDAILKPLASSRIIFLGTPQTEMSLYNELGKRGYQIRIWPALVPNETLRVAYGDRLAPFIRELDKPFGAPTDPMRFTSVDLEERLLSYGRSGFALQFMLDTTLADSDKYPLKVADLLVTSLSDTQRGPANLIYGKGQDCLLEDLESLGLSGDYYYGPMGPARNLIDWQPYTGAVMFIDPAGRGGDETAYAIVKMLAGRLYLTAAGGLKGGYDEKTVMEPLARLAEAHGVKVILIESNFGDGMFAQLLKPVLGRIYPCTVEDVHNTTQKEARIIDTLEPVMNAHRLLVDRQVIEDDLQAAIASERSRQYSLFWQMTRITKERGSLPHDDRLDALAGAVGYWLEHMGRDHKKALRSIRDRAMDEELKKFRDNVFGKRGKKRKGWMGNR